MVIDPISQFVCNNYQIYVPFVTYGFMIACFILFILFAKFSALSPSLKQFMMNSIKGKNKTKVYLIDPVTKRYYLGDYSPNDIVVKVSGKELRFPLQSVNLVTLWGTHIGIFRPTSAKLINMDLADEIDKFIDSNPQGKEIMLNYLNYIRWYHKLSTNQRKSEEELKLEKRLKYLIENIRTTYTHVFDKIGVKDKEGNLYERRKVVREMNWDIIDKYLFASSPYAIATYLNSLAEAYKSQKTNMLTYGIFLFMACLGAGILYILVNNGKSEIIISPELIQQLSNQ